MKKLLFIAICVFALSANAVMSQDTKAKDAAEDSKRVKKAKELLSKVIENAGGLNKLREVKSMYVEGVRDVVDPARGIKEPFRFWWVAPDLFYAEYDYQKPVKGGYDGKISWAINPYMSGSPDPAVIQRSDQKFYPEIIKILLPEVIRYEDNKIALRYEDEHELKDGKDYAKVRITKADNSQEDYYFNPTTKMLYKRQLDDINYMERRVDLEVIFKDWQSIDGVQMPKFVQRYENGELMTNYYFNKIELNIPIDKSKFSMPVVKDTTKAKVK